MRRFFARFGWKSWVVAGLSLAVLGTVAGPYIYIHFIEGRAPAPLTSAAPTVPKEASESSDPGLTTEGKWVIAKGSVVGYRIKETLFGQPNTAIGRTEKVTGEFEAAGTTVTKASFEVDMTTVKSDESRRDRQFQGRIMQTSTYPKATFELTKPIEIGAIPQSGREKTGEAGGNLTLRGVTRAVTFDITGRRVGNAVQIRGEIPIVFQDWGIQNPSFGPAQTEDDGLLEFALNFTHA
jgi:polyisoprenoid-binding protein YceI